jgi:hypothetical protein
MNLFKYSNIDEKVKLEEKINDIYECLINSAKMKIKEKYKELNKSNIYTI